MRLNLLYRNMNYDVKYRPNQDYSLFFLSMRECIPNYFTASGLWRQVIEYSHLTLYYKMMDVAGPNTRRIALNNDAFVAVSPTLESVEERMEINKTNSRRHCTIETRG